MKKIEQTNKINLIPPNEPEVEKTIIGSLLNDPKSVAKCMEMILPEDFYDKRYRNIYNAIISLYVEGNPIDLVTVLNKIREIGDSTPDIPLILTESSVKAVKTDLKYYNKILVERSVLRSLIAKLEEISKRGYDPTVNLDDLIDETDSFIQYSRQRFVNNKTIHIAEARSNVVDILERVYEGKHLFEIKFGFYALDRITGGIEPDDMVVIAGKEKSGKTTMALQIALENASKGMPVQIFSQEMTISKLFLRLAIIESNISWLDALEGNLPKNEKLNLHNAIKKISKLPIYVNDNINSPQLIRSQVDLYKELCGIKLIVVDYLQIVKPDGNNYGSREREIADISAKMKTMAKEFRIPVIVVSAVNEDMKARESRAVHYDMDKMITIMKDDEEQIDRENVSGIVDINISIRQRMSLSGKDALRLGYKIKTGSWVNLADIPAPTNNQEEVF